MLCGIYVCWTIWHFVSYSLNNNKHRNWYILQIPLHIIVNGQYHFRPLNQVMRCNIFGRDSTKIHIQNYWSKLCFITNRLTESESPFVVGYDVYYSSFIHEVSRSILYSQATHSINGKTQNSIIFVNKLAKQSASSLMNSFYYCGYVRFVRTSGITLLPQTERFIFISIWQIK